MKNRFSSVLGLVFLLVSACNLRAPDVLTPPAVSNNPQPAQAQPTDSGACVVDTTGVRYVVQAGDNLTNIAQAHESSVDAIAVANCLLDRNRLDRGQELYIPDGLPPGESPCPVSESVGTNFVTISPSTSLDSRCLQLRGNTMLEVAWIDPPEGLIQVTFYRVNDQLPRPDVIGVDDTPDDGFAVQWRTTYGTPPSLIYAMGEDGSVSDSIGIVVR